MIRLSYGRILTEGLDGRRGIGRPLLGDLGRRFRAVHAEVQRRREGGEYGFYGLGDQPALLADLRRYADGTVGKFDDLLILGIGGSALGTRVLFSSLGAPAWNELPAERRAHRPRLTILENIDPLTVGAALARLDPRRTLVNVVSKSGGTAETAAQYLVVRAWLEAALGADAARDHLVLTTDPKAGALRQIADAENIRAFPIPPEVGGRFSVLTSVGLLPAAILGFDTEGLLAGASRALAQAESDDLLTNPAACYAALLFAADAELGAKIHVLMPYVDRLRDLGAWFVQLWAESLGKAVDRAGRTVHRGPTPLSAVGATDQHSQVQLFMEGPFDKVVTFVMPDDLGDDVVIPARAGLPAEMAYLQGHSLGALLRAEYEATSAALARQGRMNATLRLPDLHPASVGALLMFLQIATGYAGVWYDVNPFDQPGVELGKRLTFAAMGRPGYTAEPAGGADATIG
jgi:glucose-6-phosphate isomerase